MNRSLVQLLMIGTVCAGGCSTSPKNEAASTKPPVTPSSGPWNDHLDYWRGKYDRVYRDENQTVYLDKPSEFMVKCLSERTARPGAPAAGRALDLGAGTGRNSFALAEAGYTVTAIDISSVGLAKVREAAEARHLKIQTIEADAYAATYEPGAFGVIAAIYFSLPEEFVGRMAEAVTPGGAIIIEGYPSEERQGSTPLADRFPGWEIVYDRSQTAMPDWFWRTERDPAPITQFFAYKPLRP